MPRDLKPLIKALRSDHYLQGPVMNCERGGKKWYYTVTGVACEVYGVPLTAGTGPTIREYGGCVMGVPDAIKDILPWEKIYELESNGLTFKAIANYIERKVLGSSEVRDK